RPCRVEKVKLDSRSCNVGQWRRRSAVVAIPPSSGSASMRGDVVGQGPEHRSNVLGRAEDACKQRASDGGLVKCLRQ
ncbi:unnamed protein product, partial [Amoebophrya sp. A120]